MDIDPTKRSPAPGYPLGYGADDRLRQDTVAELVALHDVAGPLQRGLLEQYPGAPDTLPVPLRGDLEYYDGAQFFMLHIAETLEKAGYQRTLPEAQHVLLVSTNGLNDWWMDESGWGKNGERDYDSVIEAFDGINAVCYSYLRPADTKGTPVTFTNPEIQPVVDYYDYALGQMPEELRPSIARLLISINLYQGVSLYQERGFREHLELGGLDLDGRNIHEGDLQMLDRMRIEKGGFIFTYLWPYFPEITSGIVIPEDRPPTIEETIGSFLDGNSLYSEDPIVRHLLEVGSIIQVMDDSCDRAEDWGRGVVSPENVGPAYSERSNESWGDMVGRVLGELTALLRPDHGEGHVIAVDALSSAIAGLTRYRANRYGSETH